MNIITAATVNNSRVFYNQRSGKPEIMYKKAVQRDLAIKIDVREGANSALMQRLRERLTKMGMDPDKKIIVERLDIFDVIFVFVKTPDINFGPCIERKTAADLAASICDGRYREQKGRMASLQLPASKAIMLYEGNLVAKHYGIDPKSLLGATINPIMRSENDIIMTQNVDATADIIVEWLRYLEHMDEPNLTEHYSYVDYVQNNVRKRDFKSENTFALMIKEFVFGATADVAKIIITQYDSLAKLQYAFMSSKAKTLTEIANMSYSVNGNPHTIGPARATALYKMCDVDALKSLMASGPRSAPADDDDDDERETRHRKPKKQRASLSVCPPHMHRELPDCDDVLLSLDDDDLIELLGHVDNGSKK